MSRGVALAAILGVRRYARTAGLSVRDVIATLEEFSSVTTLWGGLLGWMPRSFNESGELS
jgi:hypothetical protein